MPLGSLPGVLVIKGTFQKKDGDIFEYHSLGNVSLYLNCLMLIKGIAHILETPQKGEEEMDTI